MKNSNLEEKEKQEFKIVVDIKLYRNGQKAGFATISSDSVKEIISKFKTALKATYISSILMNEIQEYKNWTQWIKCIAKLKKEKRTFYEEVGYTSVPDLSPGIWLVEHRPNSKSQTSLIWKVGELKRPVDVVTHAALQSFQNELSQYLVKLGQEGSPELDEAREILGGFISKDKPIGYYNISASDLCSLFLRRIALEIEQGEKISWQELMLKYRETSQLYKEQDFVKYVKTLWDFIDFIKKNNYELKQTN